MKKNLVFVLLIQAMLSFQSLFAEPVAMVTELTGNVLINNKKVDIFSEISSGSVVKVSADSKVMIVYMDSGKEFSVTGPATVSVENQAIFSDTKPLVANDLLAEGMDLDMKNLTHAAIVMRGKLDKDKQLILVYPYETAIIDDRPEFSWVSPGEEFVYQFTLSDSKGQVIYQADLKTSRTMLPDSITLPRDVSMTWAVDAKSEEQQYSGSGTFSVLPEFLVKQVKIRKPKKDAALSEKQRYLKFLDSLNLKAIAENYSKETQ